MKFAVAGKSDKSSKTDTKGEKDLRGSIDPNLNRTKEIIFLIW